VKRRLGYAILAASAVLGIVGAVRLGMLPHLILGLSVLAIVALLLRQVGRKVPETPPPNPAKAALVDRIVNEVPRLRTLLGAHVPVSDEQHPYAFLWASGQFVGNALTAGAEPELADARRVVEVLEEAIGSSDDEVRFLISVAFLESVVCEPFTEVVRSALPPKLRRAMDEQE
jgi:hypothetical protein